MAEHYYTGILRKILETRPDEAFIVPDGSALALLGGPDENTVILILAPTGTNFNDMSDEEANQVIVNYLK